MGEAGEPGPKTDVGGSVALGKLFVGGGSWAG